MKYLIFSGITCPKDEWAVLQQYFDSFSFPHELMLEEQEMFVNSPLLFEKLEGAQNAVAFLIRQQTVVLLVDVERKVGSLYKGPEIDVFKKEFLPRFQRIYNHMFYREDCFLDYVEDVRCLSNPLSAYGFVSN